MDKMIIKYKAENHNTLNNPRPMAGYKKGLKS